MLPKIKKKVSKFDLKPIKNKNYDEYTGNITLDYSHQRVNIKTKKISNIFEVIFYHKDKKRI